MIFSTHNIAEAERYGERLLVIADGEALFYGTVAELHQAEPVPEGAATERDFERAFIDFLAPGATEPTVRWLLRKDLQLLRRSPLVTALLVLYPIALAILIGLALSAGPSDPRVAFLNQIPEGEEVAVGGSEVNPVSARGELCGRVECVDVDSEEEARQMVEDGEVLAALILPEDFADQVRSLGGLSPTSPTVHVIVNEEDPVKAQLVEDRISTPDHRGEPDRLPADLGELGGLPRPPAPGRRVLLPRPEPRRPRPREDGGDPDRGQRGDRRPEGEEAARAGDRVRRARP